MSGRRPRPPRHDTQEGRILRVLRDGRVHTLHDWPSQDVYTGRNAISRLKSRGYRIKSWKKKGEKVQRYQLELEQAELPLVAAHSGGGR